ncbi:MAG: hypothetical protein E7465_04215 [Ruminococcaceae bacterium]|nr:hypothetical protein [Oscillospiraceae bacterium]
MKKWMILCISLLAFFLTACGGGNASEVQVITGESALFTEAEIEDAMETAMNYFRKEFDGCTMTKIEYIESKSEPAAREWAQQYGADEAIVLYSVFDVDASGGDGSLNPNSTYSNWQWVLTRNQGEDWVLRTWGYG